jgi:hypothetical protein
VLQGIGGDVPDIFDSADLTHVGSLTPELDASVEVRAGILEDSRRSARIRKRLLQEIGYSGTVPGHADLEANELAVFQSYRRAAARQSVQRDPEDHHDLCQANVD